MKFSILQQDFLPALQTVSRSIGIRSNLPVLDNICLTCEDKKLKISATNLEIGVIRFINIDIEIEGELTVPAKTLLEIVSGLKGRIDLESEGDVLSIQSDKFKASINGIPATEFPAIPLPEKEGVVIEKNVLMGSLQVLFACAVDEGRPVLTGVLSDFSKKSVNFVATDGFRLAHRVVEVENNKIFKTLIPKKTFEEVLRVVSEQEDGDILVSTSENQNQIIFSIKDTIISSRLIEGQFPAWEKIIPTNIVSRVVLNKEEILKVIKLASIFAKNEANVLVISLKKDSLVIKSSAKELGSQENQVEAQLDGEEMEIAFNSRFLIEAISNCPGTKLSMEFSGPLSPSVIKPVGIKGLEYIVMPVRLN